MAPFERGKWVAPNAIAHDQVIVRTGGEDWWVVPIGLVPIGLAVSGWHQMNFGWHPIGGGDKWVAPIGLAEGGWHQLIATIERH
jgi:hypothetical protein